VKFSKILERFLQLIPVLLGISLIVFFMIELTPGDPVEIMLGDEISTPEQEASLRHEMGLDQPVHFRYYRFISNALVLEFGQSFYHRRPVIDLITERLPATIELTIVAMFIAIFTAVPLGVIAAIKKNSFIDKIATVGALFGVSMPAFWFGLILIMFFSVQFNLLPVSGRITYDLEVPNKTYLLLIDTLILFRLDSFFDALKHILMPALTLGLAMGAVLMRVTRTSMLEVMSQDYIVFAESKGLKRFRIICWHALKNALIPTVTVAALETGSLLGGNMIVETIFGWPGLGRLVVESIFDRNYPIIQTAVLLYATTYVLMNFIADVLYTFLNPRVSL